MSCDACKRIPVLTKRPCHYCGRLNVEAELAAEQLRVLKQGKAESCAYCATNKTACAQALARLLEEKEAASWVAAEELVKLRSARDETIDVLGKRLAAADADLDKLTKERDEAANVALDRLATSTQVMAEREKLRSELANAVLLSDGYRDKCAAVEKQRDGLREQAQAAETRLREERGWLLARYTGTVVEQNQAELAIQQWIESGKAGRAEPASKGEPTRVLPRCYCAGSHIIIDGSCPNCGRFYPSEPD